MTNLVQSSFRIRTDATAAEGGTPIWAAAQNVNANVPANIPFRIRLAISNLLSVSTSINYGLYYALGNINSAYTNPTGYNVSGVDATHGVSSNGQRLTTGYLTGVGTFSSAGKYATGIYENVTIPGNSYVELEFGLQIQSPATDGYTLFFRLFNSSTNGGIDGYTNTPSFNMPNSGLLAATEANDTIIAAGNVPRAGALSVLEMSDFVTGTGTVLWHIGILNVIEANDILTASGVATPILGVLTANETDDVMHGSGAVIPVGGLWARLTATEASDVLVGLGTGSGDVGSLNTQEAPDGLVGAAMALVVGILNATEDDDTLVSATLLWADQWVEAEGCAPSMWTPVDCGESLPPFPPIPDGGGGGDVTTVMELTMEQLPVLSLNQIGNFSHTPNMELCTLTVDGRPFFPVGSPPDFSVSGSSITWLSSIYSVDPSSTVIAQYSWTSNG